MNEKSEHIGRMEIILEITGWMTLVVLGWLAVALGALSIRGASLLCVFMMLGLMASAWRNFEGGRHPCFLFLSMLFVFQCGRLLGYMSGSPDDPFAIQLGTAFRFSVSRQSEEITLLLIVVSAVCVYIPCRFSYRRIVFSAGPEQAWLRPLYMLLTVTLPFAAYKNYVYLAYIRSHGGYISVYTDNDAILQSAGTLVRGVALIGTSVLLLLYLCERRRRYMSLILSLFFIVSMMDLLMGFRGKIFVQILLFWFIHNLKTGKKFNLIPLLSTAAVISLLAVLIVGFRENVAVNVLGPVGFISGQGISMNVTELAVENRQLFEKNAGRYFIGDVKSMFVPNSDNFESDLSLYLSPDSFRAGYATGSSYLAEAYLIGGVFGVAIVSLLVGMMMSWIHARSDSWIGAGLMMASLGSIIYMPRAGLIYPLSGTLKSLLAMGAAFALAFLIKTGCFFLPCGGWLYEE